MSLPASTQQPPAPGPSPQPPGPRQDGTGKTPANGQSAPAGTQPLRQWPWWLSFLVLLAVNYLLINLFAPPEGGRVQVSYTFFVQQVEADNVEEVDSRADTIQGTFRQEVRYPPEGGDKAPLAKTFSTVQPAFADPGLESLLKQHGVTINARPVEEPRNPLLTLLISFGPTLLLIGGFLWLSRQAGRQLGGGAFGMGKSQAKRYDQTQGAARVTFDDVAGIEERRTGAGRDCRLPQASAEVHAARRHSAQGCAAGRPARYRQDAARPRGGRRGRGAVLQHERQRVRRDDRRRRRQPRARPVQAGPARRPRPSSSSTS